MAAILSEFLAFLLRYHTQIALALLPFGFALPRRKHWLAAAIPLVTAYLLFPVLYTLHFGEEFWICPGLLIFGWYYGSYILYWALAMAIFYAVFQTTVKNVLFYGIAAYALQNFLSSVRSIIRLTLFDGKMDPGYHFAAFIVTCALYAAFCLILIPRLRHRSAEESVDNTALISFLLAVLFVVNVFHQFWTAKSMGEDYLVTDISGIVLTAICTLVLLALQFGFFERSALEREKQTMEQIISEMEKQQQMTAYNIEVINRKCHDLKHQIGAMRTMSDAEREKSIAELETAVMIYDSTFQTGNKVLDTVLTEKSLLCEREEISFSCVADASCLAFMETVDVFTLFGNAIDNALECVRQYTVPAQKQVALNVGRKGSLVSVRLENYCDAPLTFEDGLPRSTKGDNNYHGFGTKSIRYIVEKYGGELRMKQADDIFSLDIMFFL